MKNKYIQQLHIEIQEFESKVSNLKENQNVSFSFFRESFMHTQEIGRLLHELEFAQIEDMKNQMGKLVQFLSESETSKPKTSEELEKLEERTTDAKATDVDVSEINKGVFIKPTSIASNDIPKEAIKEDFPQFENDKEDEKNAALENTSLESKEKWETKGFIKEDSPQTSALDTFSSNNKSLNDIQPTNHTILDTKRSISLNDRFLFQRELFDNDRLAMNNMMLKLQAYSSYKDCESYLKENTDWDFKDENVQKFLEMLKKGS